jgi:hypothetical protein
MNRHPYLIRASKLEMIDSSGRETLGGLDWIVVMVLMAAGVLSAFSPWSFFMGGRFTPLAQWTGYGKMHSATGGDYGLFLRLAHHQSDDVENAFQTTPNLRGSAILCTPQGERYEYSLEGTVRNAWLQTEGRTTGLKLLTLDRQPQPRTLGLSGNDLRGVWHNGSLVLEDTGLGSAAPVAKSKSHHGKRRSTRNSRQVATVVSFGDISAFNDFCRNQIGNTRQARLVSKPSPGIGVSLNGN